MRRCVCELVAVTVDADQGTQYFTGEEAPATPAEDQAGVYRYSYVRAADEILTKIRDVPSHVADFEKAQAPRT